MEGVNWRRGDIVSCAVPGEFGGRPRPAVVVQSDLFNPTHSSVTLCPLTTYERAVPLFRVSIKKSADNGLRENSQIMIDKISTVGGSRIGAVIGRLDEQDLTRLDEALRLWLGLSSESGGG
ncbi:MAG: type II toxin-antitoxin system PemK/MazF family toxin [Opitutus sp.]|nr:type II toxin-antitoxin system PemK/MazF family toxin [Opitutus sp.]